MNETLERASTGHDGGNSCPGAADPAPVLHVEIERVAGELLSDALTSSRRGTLLRIAFCCSGEMKSCLPPGIRSLTLDRLRRTLRPGDAFRSLEDGEVLVALAGVCTNAEAALAAGRLIDLVGGTVIDFDEVVPVTLNIGIARMGIDAHNVPDLLDHAGHALATAGAAGPNRFSFAECSLNAVLDLHGLDWDDALLTGESEIDRQHKALVSDMNAIARELNAQVDLQRLQGSITRFMAHLREHFETEEAFMEACGFIGARAHRREHGDLLDSVNWLMMAEPRQAAGLCARCLHDWVQSHAVQYDRALAHEMRTDWVDAQARFDFSRPVPVPPARRKERPTYP